MKYAVIGSSAAGIFGVEALRQADREGDIIIISGEKEPAYSRCLTTYYIAGSTTEKNMYIRPGDFFEKNNVDVHPGTTVESIDPVQKKIYCSGPRGY
ncbi:MAG: NAD(P)/FAD-dependent oxidoreductase [Clostridiales bacterium]|nr:NAD(P)/FAD-dependent oxidoreductase [Clostridiales bacterium]MCF8023384.1 NAD(P)/FAD-dependent oxidoreductase [Clostridiales bacterium]